MSTSHSLRRSAQTNSRENFALEFDDALTSMFINRMEQNEELFAEFMDNEEMKKRSQSTSGRRSIRRAKLRRVSSSNK